MAYKLFTDACCDLPSDYIKKLDLCVLPMEYTMNGKSYSVLSYGTKENEDFYAEVRAGGMPVTSLINTEQFKEAFAPTLEEGFDIIYVGFSSALSGTYNAACIAARELMEKYNGRKVIAVDSRSASVGFGLLMYYVAVKRLEGANIEELRDYTEKLRDNVVHMFTVEDLNHLHRGGRVSKMTAVVGTFLDIKPVLHVDLEGRLISIGKVRKRRKSLDALVDAMGEKINGFDNPICFIGHGDSIDDAMYVKELVKEHFGINEFMVNFISPIIGAHSGPGTIALFFVGNPK